MFRATMPVKKTRRTGVWGAAAQRFEGGRFWIDAPILSSVAMEWDQIDFSRAHIHIRRLKGGIASVHPLQGDELRALRGVAQANRRPLYILQRTRRADDQIEREQDTRGRCPKSRLALSASAHAPPYLRASSSGCWSRHTTALAMARPCGHQTHCALLGAECEAV